MNNSNSHSSGLSTASMSHSGKIGLDEDNPNNSSKTITNNVVNSNYDNTQKNKNKTTMLVSRLPYKNPHGVITGHYTGQVTFDQNDGTTMTPHGSGVLIYTNVDRGHKTCVWKEGVPVREWKPGSRGKNAKDVLAKDGDYETKNMGCNKKSVSARKKKRMVEHYDTLSHSSMHSTSSRQQRPQQQQLRQSQQPTSSLNTTRQLSGVNETYLPHLDLGDVGSPSDMMIHHPDLSSSTTSSDAKQTPKTTTMTIDSLKVHDFAFILRSDGQWTYAIIANRTSTSIRFVVDGNGGTKNLSNRCWMSSIRLVNDGATGAATTNRGSSNRETVVAQETSKKKDEVKSNDSTKQKKVIKKKKQKKKGGNDNYNNV